MLTTFLTCLAMWLLFPKSFQFMVGTFVGFVAGGFLWSVAALITMLCFKLDMSWAAIGWSFLGCAAAGIVCGNVIAARG